MADTNVETLLQEATSWPLEKRIAHSNWKVRSAAFDYISEQMCSIRDSITIDTLGTWRERVESIIDGNVLGYQLAKAVGDPNANVMDKALDAYCDYIDVLGRLIFWSEEKSSILEKQAELCMVQLTSKCLKASKKSTVQKSIAVCMMLVEVEQGYIVLNSIVEGGFTHKVPKAVAAALEVVLEAVAGFTVSCAAFDEVEYSKILLNGMVKTKVYSHANAAVRNNVKDILVVLMKKSKRVDAAVRGILWDQLPDAMKKEVLDMVAVTGSENEKRYTKKQQAEMMASQGDMDDVEMMDVDDNGDGSGVIEQCGDAHEDDQDVDPYEFAEPKNIMPLLQKATFTVGDDEEVVAFWDCFGSKKWNARKSAVDKVREMADQAVRLERQNGEYMALVRELKQILAKDANIHCAAAAAAAAEAMAKALRQDFYTYAKQLCPAILNRFKEKNPVMSQTANSCLETFGTYCYSLKDVSDDISTALAHKNPKVCADTLTYLSFLVTRETKQSVGQCKDSLSAAVKLVPGADVKIREEAQNVVVSFAVKMGGFTAIKPYLTGLDDKKKASLEKSIREAPVSGKIQGGAQKDVVAAVPKKKTAVAKPAAAPKPVVATKAAMPVKKAPSVSRKTSTSLDVSLIENQMSADEAEEYLVKTFGAEIVEGLTSSLWQERLGSICKISDRVREVLSTRSDASSLLLCLAKVPGWEDKNFQVVNKLFEISTSIAEESKAHDFGFQHASCIVQGAVEKIHEIKHRAQATSALNAACGRVGPKFVVSCVHQKAATHKNPKVMSECLFWMTKTIEQFGYRQIDNGGSIVTWMNEDLGSSNPSVKAQALSLLGECHAQVGPDPFQSLLNTLKPALVTSLQEVFAKRPVDPSYEPVNAVSVHLKDLSSMVDTSSAAVAADIDDMCPDEGETLEIVEDIIADRVDVSGQFNDSLISQLTSSNWKERNAAVDAVAEIISTSKHITPNIPSDLLSAMKARFGDSNRNLAAKSFSVVGMLASAVGQPFDKIAHGILLSPAVANLADSKKQVREAVVGMLDAWGNTCTKERLFPALAEAVSNPKGAPEGRVYALKWMIDNYVANAKCKEVACKASAVASRDKVAEVRNMAAKLEALSESGTSIPAKTPAKRAPVKTQSITRTLARSVVREKSKSRLAHTPAPKSAIKQRPSENIEVEEGPLIRMSQGKGSRNRQYRPKPGGFDPPSVTDKARLNDLLEPVVSASLCAKMFSKDFKDHVEAADILIDAIPIHMSEMTMSLDLFLQWSVLILCEANMQSSMKTLDLLSKVLENLSDDGYRLNDMEASILLPAIIEKSGQNQDFLRSAYRSIIVLVASIYNPAKVIDYIVQGLVTKNSRTKVECCAALSEIVEQNGNRCILSAKQKPVAAISEFVRERDPSLRTAAMNTLQLIYTHVGDSQFTQLLHNVREEDREIIENKLRKGSQQVSSSAPDVQPMDITPAAPRFQPREEYVEQEVNEILDYKPHNLEMTPESGGSFEAEVDPERETESIKQQAEFMQTPVSNMLQAPPDSINIDTPVPTELKTTPGVIQEPTQTPPYKEEEFEQRWSKSIDAMYTADLSVSVEATKQICSDLMSITSKDIAPPSRRILAVLANSADKFVLGICAHLEITFADATQQVKIGGPPPSARGCKFALNALLQSLRIREIAQNIPQPTLRTSLSLLLCSLVDEYGLLCFDEGTTLVRAVNVLIKNILDSADKNYCFAALLHLLRSPPRTLNPTTLPKFNDLVVKCLIKLTKGIDNQSTDIDLSFLLLCLHDYFMFLGVEEIRKRSAAEDKPLRMVKTILHQICKVTGYNVYQYTSSIPGRHSQPQPIIFRYIDINLKMLKEMNQLPSEPMTAGGKPAKLGDAQLYTMIAKPESSGEEDVAKFKLKDILSRVTSRDESTREAAMRELLIIKRNHPRMLDKYLKGTQERFRNYIEESLTILESKIPLSSPEGLQSDGYISKSSGNVRETTRVPQVSSVDMLAERMARLKQQKMQLSK